MKAEVVYESFFGNTKEVAEAIARGLADRFDVVTVEVKEAGAGPAGVDLLVVGGPTHVLGMSRGTSRKGAIEQAVKSGIKPMSKGAGIREWLKNLPEPKGWTLAATFDTSLKSRWFPTGSAARSAASKLKKKGFEIVGKGEQFYVGGTEGPLIDGELERAEEWGRRLGVTASTAPGLTSETAIGA